jgi:hypothetical protein
MGRNFALDMWEGRNNQEHGEKVQKWISKEKKQHRK